MANRPARRRQHALFVRANIESHPAANDTHVPCDWPGCLAEWQLSCMPLGQKVRKVVARRCLAHRLSAD